MALNFAIPHPFPPTIDEPSVDLHWPRPHAVSLIRVPVRYTPRHVRGSMPVVASLPVTRGISSWVNHATIVDSADKGHRTLPAVANDLPCQGLKTRYSPSVLTARHGIQME